MNEFNGGNMVSSEQNSNDTKRMDIEDGMFDDFDSEETGWYIASLSDDGLTRSNNEDAIFTFSSKLNDIHTMPTFGIFIVADGIGGHLNGEIASSLTVRTVAKILINDIYLPMLNKQDMTASEQSTTDEVIIRAIKEANRLVLEQADEGGCTCTVAVINQNIVNIGHVGDSRLYIINKSRIEAITRNHSVVGRLVEIGQVTPAEAKTHPQRSVLYRSIGMRDINDGNDIEVDIHRRRIKSGESILLCSDGLSDMVDDKSIHDMVINAQDPHEACQSLVKKANVNGGIDNISVIIASSATN